MFGNHKERPKQETSFRTRKGQKQKSFNDHFVRAKLPNTEMTGRSESCGKGYCQVFNFICDTDTSSTKTCGETFRIQSRTLNCNSEKVDHRLKYRICGEAPYFGKAKTKLKARFNNYKSAHRSFGKKRKVLQQCFQQ